MNRTNRRFRLPLIFLCLLPSAVFSADLKNENLSTFSAGFEAYPAKAVKFPNRYASKVILTTPRSRRYRTIISLEGKKEPNFAGTYRVVTWGCGTDCHGFAIVDRITGKAFTDPVIEYVAGVMGNDQPRIDFRPDSRLLILTGLINDDLEGQFFYEWTGKGLRLINRAPVTKDNVLDDAIEGN